MVNATLQDSTTSKIPENVLVITGCSIHLFRENYFSSTSWIRNMARCQKANTGYKWRQELGWIFSAATIPTHILSVRTLTYRQRNWNLHQQGRDGTKESTIRTINFLLSSARGRNLPPSAELHSKGPGRPLERPSSTPQDWLPLLRQYDSADYSTRTVLVSSGASHHFMRSIELLSYYYLLPPASIKRHFIRQEVKYNSLAKDDTLL